MRKRSECTLWRFEYDGGVIMGTKQDTFWSFVLMHDGTRLVRQDQTWDGQWREATQEEWDS